MTLQQLETKCARIKSEIELLEMEFDRSLVMADMKSIRDLVYDLSDLRADLMNCEIAIATHPQRIREQQQQLLLYSSIIKKDIFGK